MNKLSLTFTEEGFIFQGIQYKSSEITDYVPPIIECFDILNDICIYKNYLEHNERIGQQRKILLEFIQCIRLYEEIDRLNTIHLLKDVLDEVVDFVNSVDIEDVFRNELNAVLNSISIIIKKIFDNELTGLFKLKIMYDLVKEAIELKEQLNKRERELSNTVNALSEKSIELSKFVNEKKNKSSIVLYDDIHKDFTKLEKTYRWLFILVILSTLILTIGYDPLIGIGGNIFSLGCSISSTFFHNCSSIVKPVLYPFNSDTLKFVIFKLTVLIVGVTLTTYFLRLSGFYQLKQEQAKQTKLELSAFPDFVSGMDPSVANNLRQELALKYFGKEIDKTMIEKNGVLFQEQIKAGTELIKASAEMVKTVKPSTAKEEDSEAKDKNKNE
jgi:hypothetical protein